MSNSDTPKEWWIVPEDRVDVGSCYSSEFEGTIHVIEHSAYAELQALCRKLMIAADNCDCRENDSLVAKARALLGERE